KLVEVPAGDETSDEAFLDEAREEAEDLGAARPGEETTISDSQSFRGFTALAEAEEDNDGGPLIGQESKAQEVQVADDDGDDPAD
ncbi:MAG: hypothetical protein JNM07_14975, partial [Phycisphaerae bacterium]|nr:hypothetical protein [Phycisphaerae bacterium]